MTLFNKTLFLFTMSSHPSLLEKFYFQTVGFIIVIIALSLIALIIGLSGRLFKKYEGRPALEQVEDSLEIIAVISAAVYSEIDESHKIVSIRPVVDGKTMSDLYLQAWSIEGRRQHFASHKIR